MRHGSRWKTGTVLVATIAALLAGGSLLRWLFAPAAPPKLANQIWVERVHRTPRDLVHHLILIEDSKARHFGAAGRSSRWRVNFDVLTWSHQGDKLRLVLPQDRHRLDVTARTWACKGEAPAPFELCLELRQNRRKVRLYSRKDWVVGPGQAVDQDVAAALPGVPALLEQLAGAADQDDADEAGPTDEKSPTDDRFAPLLPAWEEAHD